MDDPLGRGSPANTPMRGNVGTGAADPGGRGRTLCDLRAGPCGPDHVGRTWGARTLGAWIWGARTWGARSGRGARRRPWPRAPSFRPQDPRARWLPSRNGQDDPQAAPGRPLAALGSRRTPG